MALSRIDHVFIGAADIEGSRNFYVNALGFEEMPRPAIPFPGYWLGVGGQVQIHMGPANRAEFAAFYASPMIDGNAGQSGVIDHVAFAASDPRGVRKRLDAAGISYRRNAWPQAGIYQIVVRDPDGVSIELNFAGIDPSEWDAD